MSIRAQLMILAVAVLAPVVAIAVVLAVWLTAGEKETVEYSTSTTAESLATSVEAVLQSSVSVLAALSASRRLESDDHAGFHDELVRTLKSQPTWANVHLSTPDGQQIANPLRAYGDPLPRIADMESVRLALAQRSPAVGDLVVGPVSRKMEIAVRFPVVREGNVRYILSAIVRPDAFGGLLRAESLPRGANAALLDGKGRHIAASDETRAVGETTAQSLAAAAAGASQGTLWVRGPDSAEVFTAYTRIVSTGWTLAVGMPHAMFYANRDRTARMLGLGVLLATAIALILAWGLGRRVSAPIVDLARAARAIGKGDGVRVPRGGAKELDAVAAALEASGQAVRERERRLVAADLAKNEFLATLSHELRTPLSAIVGASHVLRIQSARDPNTAHACDIVGRQAEHITRLIDDLLDVSRVTMGKITLERAPVDVATLARELLATLRDAGRLQAHEVTLQVEPAWVLGDSARLLQILSNLVGNALKFTPPGGVVAVHVERVGDRARITVTDTGVGLSPEIKDRLFEAFMQGQQPVDRAQGGLGVGLSIVKRLAEMHGGAASAGSEGLGKGSQFVVELPAIEPPNAGARSARNPQHGVRPRRILIVEDNDDARRALVAALQLHGHEVFEAADGHAAVEQAQRLAPEVVFLDIGLPGLDGYQVARRLRSAPAGRHRVAIVAVTGYGQEEDRRRALEAGVDIHLAKPVAPQRIDEVLAALDE